MNKKYAVTQKIQEQGLLPLYFQKDKEISIEIMKAVYEGGVRTIEYTNRGENALENFIALKRVRDREYKDMYLGAGTIKDTGSAEAFMKAGADFIVCPGLVKNVIHAVTQRSLLCIPGCMTPTEIMKAEVWGAKIIKLFSGGIYRPAFVKTIRPLFPRILFMPTGGIETTEEALKEWFDSGICTVGIGRKLIRGDFIERKDYRALSDKVRDVLQLILSVRED